VDLLFVTLKKTDAGFSPSTMYKDYAMSPSRFHWESQNTAHPGVFAELPRYFADADKVMDLETRLMWCMEKLQGAKHADLVKRPYPSGGQPVKDLGAIATYVASKSSGMKYAAKLDKPQETAVVAMGHDIFFRRQGPHDFSCATCHNDAAKRIRLQGLPYLANPAEAKGVVGEWPAYRVSTTQVMTM
jgi:sulfur-oxidizing protein SoxA